MEKYILCILSLQVFLAALSALAVSQSLPPPHSDECAALLEFRGSLKISSSPIRKLGPWKFGGDCCAWDGVECDSQNRHVIGLDLSWCGIYGTSIDSNSSLVRLLHLQKLSLANNNFMPSRIPPSIGNFSGLTSLNLSGCGFSGQVPSEIIGLTNLSSLDLSYNFYLRLESPDLESLVQSLNKLEELDLSGSNLSRQLPIGFRNLSSLRSLIIRSSDLQGEFPNPIFLLPKLQVLDVSFNPQLSGHLLEFNSSSPLESLSLSGTNFSGELPFSLGSHGSLNSLMISGCKFGGLIPSSLSNLIQLSVLDLSANDFHGPVPSLEKLSQLTSLRLSGNRFSGDILSSVENLIFLEHLDLNSNNFTGQISSDLMNLTKLDYLDVSNNGFRGTVKLDRFYELHRDLNTLRLSFNNLSVIANSNMTPNLPSNLIRNLGLASCKLDGIPKLLENQELLFFLDLSRNKINGRISSWFLNVSIGNLRVLDLSYNLLTGFEESRVFLKWRSLSTLDLRFNKLQGSLPVPPEGITIYLVSDNELTGEISPQFCNCTLIRILDLSRNHLNSAIPHCFGSLSEILLTLSLQGNNLSGTISPLFGRTCDYIKMIDLSNHRFEGSVPRSLSGCTALEFLNLGNNNLNDTFPSWLGSLASLSLLILRSNDFHGAMEDPNEGAYGFPKLRIVDLSQNELEGNLPSKQIESWTSMKDPDVDNGGGYLGAHSGDLLITDPKYRKPGDEGSLLYDYSMTIMNKGLEMQYPKILDYLTLIDLSSNNFSGEIPSTTASLKGLHLLNLSNNVITGPVPSFLGGLVNLEALNLSRNNLSGEIPQELTQLNFLSFFNVSGNYLFGPIPGGKQFDTFGISSYGSNEGLCGRPLTELCGNLKPPPAGPDGDSDMPFYIEWKAVAVGYASSFIVAAIVGHKIVTVRPDVIARTFRLRKQGRTQRQR